MKRETLSVIHLKLLKQIRVRFATIDPVEMTEEMRNLDREIPTCGSVIGGKHNKCVIFPVKSSMIAESMERSNKNW